MCFVSIAFQSKAQLKSSLPENLKTLQLNVWNEIHDSSVRSDAIKPILDKLQSNGEWPDIDYTDKQRGSWPVIRHLSRILKMVKVYQNEKSAFYHQPKLLTDIKLALDFWLNNDFQCPNWWYPQIGVPLQMAPILILMEKELSLEQLTKGIKILDRAKIGMTGQNKVWLSGNVLLKSLLMRDDITIRKASSSIKEELKVSMGEGIQSDGSFHQHGPQIQFGNYGLSYVDNMIKWIRILRNTPFQFDESKLAILRDYLLNGQQWIVWKNQMDISACGRQLFVDAQRRKARDLARDFVQMETLDPNNKTLYNQANKYETLSGNKHFWRSDFQVQRTPEYYFSVKMCSERVLGAESCNSENIQGYYLGDGATYLYQSGKEYENIFPYWDWKKIPGTTTQQDNKALPVLTASGYHIPSKFVGGVSDGKNGIAVMDYHRDGVSVKKAWFIFNDQIVCLGAGINSNSGLMVTTSVNQSFLSGEVVVKTNKEQILPVESSEVVNPKWILHDRIGYFFPDGGKLKLENKTVTGSWNRVALMYKEESINNQIFKLWFEHGVNPSGKTYAYCLVPQATKAKMQKLEDKPSFQIVKNGTDMQSVVSSDKHWGGVAFYKALKSDFFGGIATDKPCVVMLIREKKGMSISVSDPTQNLEQIKITLKGIYKTGTNSVNCSQVKGHTELLIDLPKGNKAGQSVLIGLTSI